MELSPQALSPDGYIIDQRRTDHLRFGLLPSSKNGCGWIAAYNFLKAMERDPDPDRLFRSLERSLPLSLFTGVNLFALAAYLRLQHIPLHVAVRPIHADMLVEQCKAGIIFYRAGKTNHYAAFRREPNGKLRFFGAINGAQYDITTLAEFRWNRAKSPLTVIITAN